MAKFKKEALRDLIYGESEALQEVSDEVTGNSRWAVQHTLVFQEKATGRFFMSHYQVGATEQQFERPYENDGDEIEVYEVVPVQRTVTVYERAPKKVAPPVAGG